ncbi:glycosyl transferase [Effusibacillus lacus]|uniref:Glycosyl transferase n=1 Tax=Effusibacillus lacus TaxID=1348429 RepID=A0A292YSS9_9BACL|nr:glycosyltransferase involved in cell wall biosynthesis [Effusibacillus lacus]GAX91979.1 glycosyl transferase [Effusibacillus lacus]
MLLVSHDSNPEMVTGSEKVLLMVAFVLQKLQLEVMWFSPQPGLSTQRAIEMGVKAKVIPFPLLWSFIHAPNSLPDELNLLQQDAEGGQLEQAIACYSPDLIVANSVINVMPALIARKREIPLWWYIHEVMPNQDGMHPLLTLILSHSSQILVPSRAVKDSLSQSAGRTDSIVLLPYGVEIPPYKSIAKKRKITRSQNGWTDNRIVIGWFGSVYPGKGLLEVVRAAVLFKHIPNVTVVAAGNIVDPGYFTLCMEESKQLASVEFQYRGIVPAIEDILPAVDVVVVPSLVEEAFPNVVLEAMAFGKAIVAYQSGSLKEMIIHQKTGLLTDKGDIQSVSALLTSLIQDPEKIRRLGSHGRKRAARIYAFKRFESRLQRTFLQWIALNQQERSGNNNENSIR